MSRDHRAPRHLAVCRQYPPPRRVAASRPRPALRRVALLALSMLLGAPAGACAQRASPTARAAPQPPPAGSPAAIDTLLLRSVTRALADDSLAGRETGSPGSARAARYIIAEARRLGLEPSAPDGEFARQVPIRTVTVDATSHLMLHGASDSAAFAHGRDFLLLAPDSAATVSLRNEASFLGTGEDAPGAIAPSAVRGRVLAVLGPLPESADSLLPVWAASGAASVLLLLPDSAAFAAARRELGAPRFQPEGAVPLRHGPPLPVLVAGLALSRSLLAGLRLPPRPAGAPFVAARLPYTVSLRASLSREPVDAVNIAALIPGSDPELRNELVVYTAHYDHIGTGEPDESGDSIYNGFSDNAAGVAMLLGIAEVMRRVPPARSVAFLFLTGEERGLLGSTHAAAEPPWPGGLARIKALINLDGGAPPVPPVAWRIAGGLAADSTTTPLGALANRIATAHGWTTTLETARPISDFWPFAKQGVPAIFPIPGNSWEATTPAQRTALLVRWDRYHQPGDEYRNDFPFRGLQRYAEFALAIGRAAATR